MHNQRVIPHLDEIARAMRAMPASSMNGISDNTSAEIRPSALNALIFSCSLARLRNRRESGNKISARLPPVRVCTLMATTRNTRSSDRLGGKDPQPRYGCLGRKKSHRPSDEIQCQSVRHLTCDQAKCSGSGYPTRTRARSHQAVG